MESISDYSCAYVTIRTNHPEVLGHGLTFTIGRGNEIVAKAIESLAESVILGLNLDNVFTDFAGIYRRLTSDTQFRWLGPEKGVIHLASAALLNTLWDLWAKYERKPLWQLLCDLPPTRLVGCIDFRYICDALTPDEALSILESSLPFRSQRIEHLREYGLPAYTTSAGWLGYDDEKIRSRCRSALAEGWHCFKMKVGATSIDDDQRRASIIREEIGKNCQLAMDANQRWDIQTAIENMKRLEQFNPLWIEEPTNPDDILGHATIAKAIAPIGVATGEQCHNRVMFKQLLQAKAISFCQIDSCRLGGVNENLAVILMAKKFGIPVCPHAGGVGLCEYVQHLAAWDYIAVSGEVPGRVVEYVDHLHEHFLSPPVIKNGHYMLATDPGYSIDMKEKSLDDYRFPDGPVWSSILSERGYSGSMLKRSSQYVSLLNIDSDNRTPSSETQKSGPKRRRNSNTATRRTKKP